MRMKWILAGLATGLLAAAITGGVALAGGFGDRHPDRGVDKEEIKATMAGKVAEILGTDEQATLDAIAQVREEMQGEAEADRQEMIEIVLDAAVETGRITQERADEIRAQIESSDFGKRRMKGFGFALEGREARMQEFADRVAAILGAEGAAVFDAIQQSKEEMRAVARGAKMQELDVRLQGAVESGRITEEQADEIRAKIESGEWRERGEGRRHHRRGHRGRGHNYYYGGSESHDSADNDVASESTTY